MSDHDRQPLSVTIITKNEEADLPRALDSVKWADEVIVVDSGSSDRTVEIAKNHGAKVFENPWPGYGKQKNFAQSKASHAWVLNIDADEEIPNDLRQEIESFLSDSNLENRQFNGAAFARKTFYLGKWIRHGGWYPNILTRMGKKSSAQWSEPEVHESFKVKGNVKTFRHPLNHYTFSSIEDQIVTNLRYSRSGSKELTKRGGRPSLIKLVLKPVGKFFETYILKRGFLDGIAGFIISVNAAHSMFLKYAYLFEQKIRTVGKNENTHR